MNKYKVKYVKDGVVNIVTTSADTENEAKESIVKSKSITIKDIVAAKEVLTLKTESHEN